MTPSRPSLRHRSWTWLWGWAVGAGLAAGGTAGEPLASPTRLKIGLVLPPGEPEAASILQGAQAGVDWVRTRSGSHVELLVRGSPGQWGTEGDDAVALALDAGAQALVAPTTGATVHLVEQVAGRTRLPVVALCADGSVTGARLPWVLRLVPDTVTEARTLMRGARTAQGRRVTRWAALVPEGRAGREAAADLHAAVETPRMAEAGESIKLTAVSAVSRGSTEGQSWLESVLQSQPEGVLVWLEPERAGRGIRALRQAGYAGVLAGPGRLAGAAWLEAAGPAAEGMYSTRPVRGAEWDELATSFRAQFQARFGAPPEPLAWAAADAVWLLVRVLESAGSTPAFQCFPLEQPLPGLTGPLAFDAAGNRLGVLDIVVARRGRWERAP